MSELLAPPPLDQGSNPDQPMQVGGPAPLFESGLDEAAAQPHATDNSEVPFRTTFEEGVAATWNQSVAARTSMALTRIYNIWEANSEGGPKMSPEELNKMYKDQTAKPFDEPMTQRAAQLIVDRQAEDRALSELTEAGPGGFVYGTANFAAGVVSSSLDPLDFASGLAVGGIFNAAIKGSKLAKGTGIIAKAAQGTMTGGQKFALSAAEGVVGNVLVEPAQAVAQRAEGMEYDLAHGFVNAVGGAVGFSGARYLGGFALEKAGKGIDHLLGRKDSLHERVQRTATAHTLEDKKVQIDSYYKDAAKAVDYNPEMHGEFRHEPELSKAIEKPMYMAADRVSQHFEGVKSQQFTEGWGEGIYLGPEHVANGTAASKYAEMPTSIMEIKGLQDLKLLDIDSHVPSDMKVNVEAAIGRPLKPGDTIANLMKEIDAENARLGIDESAKNTIKKFAENAQYKGIGFTSEALGNEKIAPHKQVFIFEEARESLSANQIKSSDPSKVQGLSREETTKNLEQTKDPASRLDYDKTIHDEVERYSQEQLPETNAREAQGILEEHLQELQDMEKQGLLDADQKATLESIREEMKKDQDTESVIQMARNCLMGK